MFRDWNLPVLQVPFPHCHLSTQKGGPEGHAQACVRATGTAWFPGKQRLELDDVLKRVWRSSGPLGCSQRSRLPEPRPAYSSPFTMVPLPRALLSSSWERKRQAGVTGGCLLHARGWAGVHVAIRWVLSAHFTDEDTGGSKAK